jgi:beta-galactosidase
MIGVDYYPEQWPRDRIRTDIRMMKQSGIRIIRIGEFAWSKLEPSEGEYKTEWLEEVVDTLSEEGFSIIVGTPTASPPPWVSRKYPDTLIVDYTGRRAVYGVRRQFCPNNPTYRELCKKIVLRIVRTVASKESVVGYQIDNELHFGESSPWRYCYCQYCTKSFREYLKRRYGGLDTLNEKMKTIFWSHEYDDWEEINPPVPPFDLYNRSLALEWIRFRSESFIDFFNFQKEIIRSIDPAKTITTNFMGIYPELDYYKLGKETDTPSTDIYPKFGRNEYEPSSIAMIYDATRCMGRKGKFWVTELQSGPTDGYNVISVDGRVISLKIGQSPEPGEIRKWFWQAVAHGAEKVLFFRWRTYHSGKEQFWHGILDHNGLENRRLREIKDISNEALQLSDALDKTYVDTPIALLFSYDALWSNDVVEQGYYDFTYQEYLFEVYKCLFNMRLQVDVISPYHDLSKYRLIIAPFLYLTSDDLLKKLEGYVSNGGLLILTARSLVKDEFNRVRSGFETERVAVEKLIGGSIEEYTKLPLEEKNAWIRPSEKSFLLGDSLMCRFFIEAFSASDSAQVLGYHTYKWFAGKPAILCNNYGNGRVVTVGTMPSWIELSKLIVPLLPRLHIDPIVEEKIPQNCVEFSMLQTKDMKYLFAINHSGEERTLLFTASGSSLKPLLKEREVFLKKKSDLEVLVHLKLNPHDVEIITIH